MKDDRAVTLAWTGKTSLIGDREASPRGPVKATPKLAAVEPARKFERGEIYQGDNLAMLTALAAQCPETVTLAYLDPPFLTGRLHAKIIKGDTLDLRTTRVAFDDRWSDRAAYLQALGDRIVMARKLLAAHGSMVVHVDTKTSHYVKVMMDEIFGEECFASEIVWRYRRWPSKTPNFQRVHDVLLRYRKNADVAPRWNTLYEPLAASTLATWGMNKQRAVVSETGRRARSSTTEEKSHGVPMGDVWDIGVIAPVARERTGYPSQKPEALLERLIEALSSPGDVVLDPYAGSGTTLAVAARLERRFIGIDASDVAMETLTARLESAFRPAYARRKLTR
ncbi:MAG: site-specific DNA-methyltransferase [Polyangiaceae bacterium]